MTPLEAFIERKITEWKGKTIVDHKHFLHELKKVIGESYVAGRQEAFEEIEKCIPYPVDYVTHMASKKSFDEGNGFDKCRYEILSNLEALKEKE